MVVPVIIAAIRIGQVLYRVSKTPAAQALAKRAMEKYGGKIVEKTAKELKGNKYITEKVLKQKDPTIPQQIGGRVNKILGKGKDAVVTKKSPGVNKSTASISGPRQAAEKTGRVVIGGTVVGVPAVAAAVLKVKELKNRIEKAKTETAREKLRADISDAVGKVQEAKQKAKDKVAAAELKAEKNKPIDKRVPGVKRSLRPPLRPKNLKDGGMPMVMKDGKKIPAYAADGIGKMNKGGMAMKKKPTTKMMAGGMAAKKKPATKKMMAGGMAAKKKMMAGGMTKSNYMYGGMAKKPKAKK